MAAEFAENFAQLKAALSSRDADSLKNIAGETARDALEFNDRKYAVFSIVAYSLAKFIEKPYILHSNRWKKFSQQLMEKLSRGEECSGDSAKCEFTLDSVVRDINEMSNDLGRFVVSVVEKSRIKTATQIYAHGASIGRAVELTGADRKELMNYIGNTRLSEKYESKNVSQRIAFADKLFE